MCHARLGREHIPQLYPWRQGLRKHMLFCSRAGSPCIRVHWTTSPPSPRVIFLSLLDHALSGRFPITCTGWQCAPSSSRTRRLIGQSMVLFQPVCLLVGVDAIVLFVVVEAVSPTHNAAVQHRGTNLLSGSSLETLPPRTSFYVGASATGAPRLLGRCPSRWCAATMLVKACSSRACRLVYPKLLWFKFQVLGS